MSDFYKQILNLRINKEQAAFADRTHKEVLAYKSGHRDARHAAAEIALETDRRIAAAEEMAETLRSIARHVDPNGADGTYRYDSANDACDFAFSRASEALAAWRAAKEGR